MIRVLLIGLLLYFLYRFVFDFLIPVIKTTKQVKQKMNDLQNQMNSNGVTGRPHQHPQPQPAKKSGDYIDFEELK